MGSQVSFTGLHLPSGQARVLQTHRVVGRIHHVPRAAVPTGEGTETAVLGARAQGRRGQTFGERPTLASFP